MDRGESKPNKINSDKENAKFSVTNQLAVGTDEMAYDFPLLDEK